MTAPKGEQVCIFCQASDTRKPNDSLLLLRTGRALVMLNRYPYTNGHIMVAPREHQASLFHSDHDLLSEIMRLTAESQRILGDVYHPDGFNVGMNFGSAAGAGFADHYHMHIVPRWGGDSNFMSVTAETRLVPEDLDVTLRKLQPKFRRLKHDLLKSDEQ